MTIGCPECGALADTSALAGRMLARCRVCHYPLERASGRSVGAALACSLATFVLLLPGNLAPLMTVHLLGAERSSVHRAEGGLGIGLALVKNLVQMHGVSATSDGPERGSTFTIRVPGRRVARRASQRVHHAQPPARSVARRVLLVDDNIDGVQALAELLKECGHHVEAVCDPTAALRIASRFEPHIAVIDIGLPIMDGYELVHRLRAERAIRGCLFVALTGYGQEADRRRSRQAGFHHHFVKPLDPSRLLHLIDTLSPRAPPVAQA